MKSCYYCNEPGTETIILGNITYSFCPNHKQVVLSMIEEDQQRKQQQLAAALSQAKK